MLVVVESKIVKNLRLEKNYFQCKYETNERKKIFLLISSAGCLHLKKRKRGEGKPETLEWNNWRGVCCRLTQLSTSKPDGEMPP